MNPNYSHTTIVLDRSGSMASIANDMEGGLQTFIKEQQNIPGKYTLSFVRFDNIYEKVLDFVDIHSVNPEDIKLEPRGATALVDSLAKAIRETGLTLDKMNENERPFLVTFVVVTDGYENASVEVTSQELKNLIEEQQNKYNWHFNYLGANQDSFAVANQYGFNVSNVINYSPDCSFKVFKNYSAKMVSARSASCTNDSIDLSYNDKDNQELNS